MSTSRDILLATLNCPYKAWLLNKDSFTQPEEKYKNLSDTEIQIILSTDNVTPNDKIAIAAWYNTNTELAGKIETIQISYGVQPSEDIAGRPFQTTTINISRYAKKAQKLLSNAQNILTSDDPPAFYRNSHCPECQFRDSCYKKLRERDCISLLGGMSPKVLAKYHKKGIYSVTQLSHLFRPRKRRGRPQPSTSYLWELKALAIRDKKTYVMHLPDLEDSSTAIYLDFEGVPDEGWVYLIGGIIKQQGKPDEAFSYWASNKDEERGIFTNLFDLIEQYSDAIIYHYGSYEHTILKHVAKKWEGVFEQELPEIEKRLMNLLGYLRTHVYPPIYSNGLKELAIFLGFEWNDKNASGLMSIEWRKEWETTGEISWKEKLLQYNQDDCKALIKVYEWLRQLATNGNLENVQEVVKMKKQSPYKFHDNPEYSEDFQLINKAAYFDYQHSRIYWRDKSVSASASRSPIQRLKKHQGWGVVAWKPKKVHEVIIAPPIKKCIHCGHPKLYRLCDKVAAIRQTDLKFTSSGIKQYVREYRAVKVKCAKCYRKYSNRRKRLLLYGDNLFAWAINLYVSYHVSHEMVSRQLGEQFGIWINPMYLIQRKQKWWRRWQPEVDYLWEIICNSPVIHIDETTVKLSKEKGYVWVFATPHTVFYYYTQYRETDFIKEWLKDYKGIIVTDSFPGYEMVPVKRQKCLVHLIRDLNDDLYKNPFDEEYKTIVVEFGHVLRKIIQTIDRHGLKKIYLQKHVKDTEGFYQKYIQCEHKSEMSIKYGKRLQKHWIELWTFLYHDDVPWNNNNAEVAVKAFAQYRRGVNGQVSERGIREFLQMLSIAQTCRYRDISFLDFLRRKAGIWENIPYEYLPGYLPFPQARLYTHKLGFERKREWMKWEQSKGSPAFIPHTPNSAYSKTGWIGWQDWIGFGFLPFKTARTYMRKLNLKNRDDYWAWQRSGKRPRFIPACPEEVYKYMGWKDLGDWLGTGNLGQQPKKKMTYIQAKAFVQALGIKTQHEFMQWRKSGQRPETLPGAPERSYYEFEGWGKFLGTDRIANQNRKYWDYEKAKFFLQPLKIRSDKHYRELFKAGIIPKNIPGSPYAYYQKHGEWKGFPDFFGNKPLNHYSQF